MSDGRAETQAEDEEEEESTSSATTKPHCIVCC